MELLQEGEFTAKALNITCLALATILAAAVYRIIYTQFFHPLSGFNGPWYATSSSMFLAVASAISREPDYFMWLMRKYGPEKPIRIAPDIIFFPNPSALKDIYRDPKCNTKGVVYASGVFGDPSLITVIDPDEHRILRKALSNAPWTIGQMKRIWEPRFDDRVNLFIEKMNEHSLAKRTISFADKLGEFALDIMSMISFTEPFGNVESQTDVKGILSQWRKGLVYTGFVSKSTLFRETILKLPGVGSILKPGPSSAGIGWLLSEANRQVATRETQNMEKPFEGTPDFLQHCLDAKFSDGSELTTKQKQAQVFLLIAAGADTTATALSAVIRMLGTHPEALNRAQAEVEAADKAGYLSSPIQYEETRQHLPFFVGCIKEGLRLYPPATNVLSRVTPPEGRSIDGYYVPGGKQVTTYSHCTQRNPIMYGEDAEDFKPERWMESEKRNFELESGQFTFGTGSRSCLGKDIAMMELYKLLPEIIRRFDIELENPGEYIVNGGIAYHKDLTGRFIAKQPSQ